MKNPREMYVDRHLSTFRNDRELIDRITFVDYSDHIAMSCTFCYLSQLRFAR